jgi:hypothetical protein
VQYQPRERPESAPTTRAFASHEGPESAQKRQPLDHDPLDLIEADLIAPAIIELRGARRGMVRHRRGLFKRAAVLEIGGDPCRPEAVVAELEGIASVVR